MKQIMEAECNRKITEIDIWIYLKFPVHKILLCILLTKHTTWLYLLYFRFRFHIYITYINIKSVLCIATYFVYFIKKEINRIRCIGYFFPFVCHDARVHDSRLFLLEFDYYSTRSNTRYECSLWLLLLEKFNGKNGYV